MLLSIVIPTKNRQYTALFAIESALAITSSDIEIIVEDCSDLPDLEKLIQERFGNEKRIVYNYNSDKPSMTDNWNNAFARTTGKYVCGIGDDDAVLPEIYDVALWALQNEIKAIIHNFPYMYLWPGYYPQPYKGSFIMRHTYSGNIEKKTNYQEVIYEFASLHKPMLYKTLPSVYHCLISKGLLKEVISETGKLLDSTSLDVYTAVVFSKFIDEYYVIDYPITIGGSSQKSNSQRLHTKAAKEHFEEFKKIDFPVFLPDAAGLYITCAESFVTACKNSKLDYLIDMIDLPVLYANIAVEDRSCFQTCLQKLEQFAPTPEQRKKFDEHYSKEIRKKKVNSIKNKLGLFIKKRFNIVYKLYKKLISTNEFKELKVIHASTIIEGIKKVHINSESKSRQLLFLKNKINIRG